MNAAALWRFLRHRVFIFDPWLSTVLLAISLISLVTMYSAAGEGSERLVVHARNLGMAVMITWLVASLDPRHLRAVAIPIYLVGLALLFGVELMGITAKGAKRWLDLGFTRIQPAELMKIAIPLMLAWFFHISQNRLRSRYVHLMAIMLLVLPVALVGRQPDLGTAILIGSAGAFVIYFAGLSWRVILGSLVVGLAAMPLLWLNMKPYQKERVLTMIDPTNDPLGKGFHIIQSTIAVGSGGLQGKGWLRGTQAHLDFVPERTTDFIFSVYAEEFGLVGTGILHRPRPDHRQPGAEPVLAPAGRLHDDDRLHLRLREHRHGDRHPARGGRAAALHVLRRHRPGDAGRGLRHADVHRPRERHAAASGGAAVYFWVITRYPASPPAGSCPRARSFPCDDGPRRPFPEGRHGR